MGNESPSRRSTHVVARPRHLRPSLLGSADARHRLTRRSVVPLSPVPAAPGPRLGRRCPRRAAARDRIEEERLDRRQLARAATSGRSCRVGVHLGGMHVREEVEGVREVGARMAKGDGATEAPAMSTGYETMATLIWGNWGILVMETDTWAHLS